MMEKLEEKIPRGIRNNNPGNIKASISNKWIHQTGVDNNAYCIFTDAVWGIRAMFIILRNYRIDYHLDTIEQIISKWAPPCRNDTMKYIKYVSDKMGVRPDQDMTLYIKFDLLVKAIISFENGMQPYSNDYIQQAWSLSHMQ